ncbi:MAG: hypothetical protein ACI9SB_001608 [Candidatus Azotimanducaceae bacterium]
MLGNGAIYTGASIQEPGIGMLPLVYAANVGLASADPVETRLCFPGTPDSAKVAGKMILCDTEPLRGLTRASRLR